MNLRVSLVLLCVELNQSFHLIDSELSRSNLNGGSRFEYNSKGLHFRPRWIDKMAVVIMPELLVSGYFKLLRRRA